MATIIKIIIYIISFITLGIGYLYFLPTLKVIKNGAGGSQALIIFIFNISFGWTVVGWTILYMYFID